MVKKVKKVKMELTPRRKKILIWYILAMMLMLAFPPWLHTISRTYKDIDIEDAGYRLIIDPPYFNPVIDWGRLVSQSLIVSGFFTIIALRSKKEMTPVG